MTDPSVKAMVEQIENKRANAERAVFEQVRSASGGRFIWTVAS